MAAVGDKVLLQSTLDVDHTSHLVTLTHSHITLEVLGKDIGVKGTSTERYFRSFIEAIDLREVVAVRTEPLPPRALSKQDKVRMREGKKVYLCIEMVPMQPHTFAVHYLQRRTKHRWRYKTLRFACCDNLLCQTWVAKTNETISALGNSRPGKLLVFVNPYGGMKKGPSIYAEKVAPLFELAGIQTDVITTQRPNHARDHLQDCDLSKYDGVVGVGGDGTFSELLNGLVDRAMREAGLSQTSSNRPVPPQLRIGIIPAGSTDAIVFSTVGINDPVTSALQIILGESLGIDVCSLYHKESFLKYSVSLIGYGYYGDLLQDSEGLRWMGPNRYKWCGFKKFVGNKSYEGEISFLLSSESNSHARDKTRCTVGCSICGRAAARDQEKTKIDLAMNRTSPSASNMAASACDKDGWHRVRGRFLGINAVSMSCRCEMTPEGVSPSCHQGDGCLDLILVNNCSRVDYLRHLYRISDRQADQFDFDFVQVYRVKEFRFQPLFDREEDVEVEEKPGRSRDQRSHKKFGSRITHNSVWNCDGEVIDHPNLHVRVHCQLIKLFAHGIDDLSKDGLLQCPPCCSSCDHEP